MTSVVRFGAGHYAPVNARSGAGVASALSRISMSPGSSVTSLFEKAPLAREDPGHRWRGYALSVAAVAAAAALRAVLFLALGQGLPFLTFFPAVMVAALYGGVGPGALAVVLS